MNNFWNERYSDREYVYGEEPNDFIAAQLKNLETGTIILPCEGEGRNAVYAASLGWKVYAFDVSDAGRYKALQLADKNGVEIEYTVDDANSATYPENSVNVVSFIYAHFPPVTRKLIHQKAVSWLKPGGKIILEAFNTQQLQNTSGGPKELSMLYTADMIKGDFEDLKIEFLQTVHTALSEGKYHAGMADIIQFVGIKS